MIEDLREAVDFVLGVRVQSVFGWGVLMEEAVLGGLEHGGRVVGEGAVRPPECGDDAVAGVSHRVVEVADAFQGEFMSRIPPVLLGDARCGGGRRTLRGGGAPGAFWRSIWG